MAFLMAVLSGVSVILTLRNSTGSAAWSSITTLSDLRNDITVDSEQDDTVSIQGVASSEASIKRYGKRTALETFSDSDTVSATAKAKNLLGKKNRTKETFSCRVYGSDKVVAGCRMKVNIPDEVGEFWVTAVSHELAPIHMMTLTMERCDQ